MKVRVKGANLSQRDDGAVTLSLTLETVNEDYPGETVVFAVDYPTSMTAQEIQAAINEAVTLLWTAHGMPQWTV